MNLYYVAKGRIRLLSTSDTPEKTLSRAVFLRSFDDQTSVHRAVACSGHFIIAASRKQVIELAEAYNDQLFKDRLQWKTHPIDFKVAVISTQYRGINLYAIDYERLKSLNLS